MSSILQQNVESLKEELSRVKSENAKLSSKAQQPESDGPTEVSNDVIKEFEKNFSDLSSRYDSLKQKNKATEDELTKTKSMLEVHINSANDVEEKLQNEIDTSQKQLAESKQRSEDLEQELRNATATVADTNEKLETLQGEYDQLEQVSGEIKVELLELKESNAKSSSDEVESLRQQLQTAKEQLEESRANQAQVQTTQDSDSVRELEIAHKQTLEELATVKSKLETLEIENIELEKALEAEPAEKTGDCNLCTNYKTQIDMLDSSLSALGLRYGGRVTVNSSNAIERLSLIARKRNSHGITF